MTAPSRDLHHPPNSPIFPASMLPATLTSPPHSTPNWDTFQAEASLGSALALPTPLLHAHSFPPLYSL